MNFLAHFYLLKEKDQNLVVFGNLLPDLFRGFTKIYHREIKGNQAILKEPFIQGILFHLKTDLIFHEHDFFLDSCSMIKAIITKHQLPEKKSYIIAHVLVELLIDQYIITQNEELGNQFYATLRSLEETEVHEKLNITLNRQNSSNFLRIFKSFIENRYAFTIIEDEGIITALHHIIGTKFGLNFDDKLWLNVIAEAKDEMYLGMRPFLKNINKELNNA